MTLNRKDGESLYDYHKRLVYGKLVDKTIDTNYSELSSYIYGRNYAPDVARRMMYGSRATLDILEQDIENVLNIDENDFVNSLLDKKNELQKERYKLQAEKTEYNRWLREDAREE